MAGGADTVKSILYALGANFSIFVAKLVAAIVTGSGSMMAESIHSLADCGNQLLLLFGIRHAKKPPSDDYPLGHGKAIYFWSFIVALILFSVGGMFSIYEGIHKLQDPQPLTYPWVAVGVLTFGIIAEGVSMWGCMREVNKVRYGRGIWQWFRESRQSELVVIFGEDLAAMLGLVFALIAVVATMVTGNSTYDALGSISIGVLLIVIAIFIGVEVKALLIGQGVETRTKKLMLEFLAGQDDVVEIYNLVTLQMGNDVMVAIKARMQPADSGRDLVARINACEAAFKDQFPEVAWLFFEPDLAD